MQYLLSEHRVPRRPGPLFYPTCRLPLTQRWLSLRGSPHMPWSMGRSWLYRWTMPLGVSTPALGQSRPLPGPSLGRTLPVLPSLELRSSRQNTPTGGVRTCSSPLATASCCRLGTSPSKALGSWRSAGWDLLRLLLELGVLPTAYASPDVSLEPSMTSSISRSFDSGQATYLSCHHRF